MSDVNNDVYFRPGANGYQNYINVRLNNYGIASW